MLPLRPNLVDLNSYKKLLYKLQAIIGSSTIIVPGTNFGPLFGTSSGIPGNFLWLNPWTPLITQSTLEILLSKNINIVAVKSYIKHKIHKFFYELEALPLFNIYYKDSQFPYDCEYCNKPNKNVLTNNIVIDSNSFDESIAIQRCKEFPAILLINQQFARIIIDMHLSNIIIDEVVLN